MGVDDIAVEVELADDEFVSRVIIVILTDVSVTTIADQRGKKRRADTRSLCAEIIRAVPYNLCRSQLSEPPHTSVY